MSSFFLLFALVYLIFTSAVMWMNSKDFKPLLAPGVHSCGDEPPLVSICIPARNEEAVIKRAVLSVIRQDYPSFELLVLNDESTDQTPEILETLEQDNPEILSVIYGKAKPPNWLGKSWACHQLSRQADGEILFFMDADVWLESNMVTRSVASIRYFDEDFITVWPYQQLGTFWEKVVIPLVYYGLLTLLPIRYVHHKPGWLPSFLAKRIAPHFAAACGQCMIFKKSVYQSIGGHKTVMNDIVEDVALAKQIKGNGFSMRMFYGGDVLSCRMYRSGWEMWQGFRKNFLALFNNSVIAFLLMVFINFIVYIFPLIIVIISLFSANSAHFLLALCALLFMFSQRVVLHRWYNWNLPIAFFHPLGVFWFHLLGFQVLKDHFFGRRAQWKNRPTS